jgi:uncharacterized protein YkwD
MTKVIGVPSHRAQKPHPVLRRLYAAVGVGLAVLAIVVISRFLVGGSGRVRTDAISRHSGAISCGADHVAGSCRPATTPAAVASSSRPHPRPTPARPAKPEPAAGSPAASPSSPSSLPAAADGVLMLINKARAQSGLPAYTILGGLQISSGKHNQLMADGCGLSHQCPGEPGLGARETAAGVQWTAAGENIGEGGPVADTSAAITQMAVALTQDMLDEKPPDDGHRLNILSSSFTRIGIAVYRSGDGTVWMTQDFAN